MLVPFNLWLPELLSTCSAIGRCLPATTASGWVTLLSVRILVFIWHASQGAGCAWGIWNGHFPDPGGVVQKVPAGCAHSASAGSLSLHTAQWQAVYPCLNHHRSLSECQNSQPVPGYSDMLDYKTQQMRMPLKDVALIVKEFISLRCSS